MTLAMIGYGEAGQAFVTGWLQQGLGSPRVFDPKGSTGAPMNDRAATLAGADAVICLVTADQALTAAQECAPHLAPGALWFDGNSCAPETKRRAAAVIGDAGGRYIDMAVMAPVHPRLHRTPVLISGPEAGAALAALTDLGMAARPVGDAVGAASTIKMLRSVMIKGMEALSAECFLAARKAGVEDEVMGSLIASNPEADWPRQAAYHLERMMTHGPRRAAEMREVVVTLRDLGCAGDLTAAVAEWHDRIGALGLKGAQGGVWDLADLALARL